MTWAVGFSVVGPSRGREGGWGPQEGRVAQGSEGTWGRRAVGHIGMKPWGPGRRRGMGGGSWGSGDPAGVREPGVGPLGQSWKPGDGARGEVGAVLGDLAAALKSAPM